MLLLIHGALGDARQMDPIADALADRDPAVVELSGHGRTPLDGPFDIPNLSRDVRRAIENGAAESVDVFGYSMGGYVALHLAVEWPGRIRRVATLGTKLAWSPDVATRETSRLDPATIRAKVPAFADLLERRHAGAGGWEAVVANTRALMTGLGNAPIVTDAVLSRIGVPVRLMVGDRDNVVGVTETAAAARVLPKGECCVLPATPHPLEQVRPSLLAALIRDFVEG